MVSAISTEEHPGDVKSSQKMVWETGKPAPVLSKAKTHPVVSEQDGSLPHTYRQGLSSPDSGAGLPQDLPQHWQQ
ncbi:hypothetical protein AAY473_012248 [Plecturocebus cupreus]